MSRALFLVGLASTLGLGVALALYDHGSAAVVNPSAEAPSAALENGPATPAPAAVAPSPAAVAPSPGAPGAMAPSPGAMVARQPVPLGASPQRGPAQAKVTVVEFSDFQCPACAGAEPVLAELRRQYGDDLRVVWKNLPLEEMHPHARAAAEAALAAGEQGRFWEMHDRLFADQAHLERADFERHAAALGLDLGRFRAALDGRRFAAAVDGDVQLATRLGAHATPSFYVNGRALVGWRALAATAAEERAAAAAALARGVAPAALYDELTRGSAPAPHTELAPAGGTCVAAACTGAPAAARD